MNNDHDSEFRRKEEIRTASSSSSSSAYAVSRSTGRSPTKKPKSPIGPDETFFRQAHFIFNPGTEHLDFVLHRSLDLAAVKPLVDEDGPLTPCDGVPTQGCRKKRSAAPNGSILLSYEEASFQEWRSFPYGNKIIRN